MARSRLRVACASLSMVAMLGSALFVATPAAIAASNPIITENQHTGSTGWKLPASGYRLSSDTPYRGQIKGYASATSINKGGSIAFKISVYPAQYYTVDIYRLGWYGGTGGRLMLKVPERYGTTQGSCPSNANGTIQCAWSTSYTLTVPTTWTSGIYLAALTNGAAYQNYIVFVVRDDSRIAQMLYQQPVATYEAYNNYPNDGSTGKSLYDYNSFGSTTTSGSVRASKVSFDRPYTGNGSGGAGGFEGPSTWEVDMIQWLERSGYDISYSTDVDTHVAGSRLLDYRAILSVGHDEYWSKQMYDAWENARDAGVGLGFFGSNGVYWQIRFEASSGGVANRIITCYKSSSADPNTNSALKTVQWRQVGRAEQTLVGIQYTNMIDGSVPYVVTNATHWIYRNTGFKDGDKVAGLVGYEGDRYMSEYPMPSNRSYDLLSHSPYATTVGSSDYTNSSLYQAQSGTWVFAVGSPQWLWGLTRSGYVDSRIQRTTANVLAALTDREPPTVAAPSLALIEGTATTTAVPTRVTWSGSDAGTYVDSYVLQMSTDGGTFLDVYVGRATSFDIQLEPGHTYQSRVKASDANGLWSGWQAGASRDLQAIQESSTAITYAGAWTSVADATAFGGAYEATSQNGASAKLSVSGMTVAWVAQKGPAGGPVAIYRDGRLATTIDLYAATAQSPQILAMFSWGGRKTHTLELRYVGSASAEGYLDALLTLR